MSKKFRQHFVALAIALCMLMGLAFAWLWPATDTWASPGQSGPHQTVPPVLTPRAWMPLVIK